MKVIKVTQRDTLDTIYIPIYSIQYFLQTDDVTKVKTDSMSIYVLEPAADIAKMINFGTEDRMYV